MKTILIPLTALLIVFVWGITGCSEAANPPTLTQVPPTSTPAPEVSGESASDIVQNMADLLTAGDLEGSLAYFSEDAMGYIIGLPPTGVEVYRGKEQIRTLYQDSIDNHFEWEITNAAVDGDTVYVRAKTWHDFTRQLGVAPLEWIDIYEIKDGKIITYDSTITEESLARLKPALAEVMPPDPTMVPSSAAAVSEMNVTIADGTCTSDHPAILQAGEIKVSLNITDQSNPLYALGIFTLDPEKDIVDLMMSTSGSPPSWAAILLLEELEPGQSAGYTFTADSGPIYLVCFSQPPAIAIGGAGPFVVQE